jgi:hypothetical protein
MPRFRQQKDLGDSRDHRSIGSNGNGELIELEDTGAELQHEMRRFTLALPDDLYKQVQEVAKQRNTTVQSVMRLGARLAVKANELDENNPDDALTFRKNGKDRDIMPVW